MNPPTILPVQPTLILVHSVVPMRIDGLVFHQASGFVYPWHARTAPPPGYRYVPRSWGAVSGVWLPAMEELLAVSADALRIIVIPTPISRVVHGLADKLPILLSASLKEVPWNDWQFSAHSSGWQLAVQEGVGLMGDLCVPYIPEGEDEKWQNEGIWKLYWTYWPHPTR